MDAAPYQIVFSGQLVDGVSQAQAKENLQKLLKANAQTIERMFSGGAMVIKKNLSHIQAENYVKTLHKAGVIVEVNPPLNHHSASLSLEPLPESASTSRPKKPEDNPTENDSSSAEESSPYAVGSKEAYAEEKVFCRQCGVSVHASDQVCRQCGAKQTPGESRSKIVAGLLAFFCGGLGVHRFYLGQWWGIFYLFIWPLSSVISLIETLAFFGTSERQWERKYGNVKPMGGIVLIIVAVPIFIAILGILAAIAIPAYQDYTIRAKVQESVLTVAEYKQHISDFIIRTNFVPNSNLDAGLPDEIKGPNLSSLVIEPQGLFIATFDETSSALSGKTIIWEPTYTGRDVTWDCSGGTLETRYRPAECRQGKYANEQTKADIKVVISHDAKTEVFVPKSWNVIDLHDEASIEVGNEFAEAYMINLPENKSELSGFDLKEFANVLLESHSQSHPDSSIEYIGQQLVSGMPALHYRVESQVNNLDIVYRFAFVEGKDSFHQILAWSLGSRYKGNADKLEAVINSFNER